MYGMRKRAFLIEQFLHMLLVIRVFTTEYVSIEIFIATVIFLFIAQYFKDGYTPKVLILFPLTTLQIFGEINQNVYLQYAASILGGLLHFYPMKLYWLPQPKQVVGFRQDILDKGLHYMQFYPLDHEQKIILRSMKWHHTQEIAKIIQYKKITNHLMKKIGHLALSFADKHKLKIGAGVEKKSSQSIVFCHGRGGTPMIYSSFMMHYAGLGYKIGGVQHSEVSDTKLKSKEEMKVFREKEVQVRAAELYQAILRLQNEKMILMGHSYGGSTVLQAYHSLEDKLKQKISHIVLLDPWFFPLTQKVAQKSISCPVLILDNEDFLTNPDMYIRNRKFLQSHKRDKVECLVWKNAHHLHQTDMGFVNGNLFRAIKHSHMSQIFFDLNNQAIDKFLSGEAVEGTFDSKDLGSNYRPQKFYSQDGFMF